MYSGCSSRVVEDVFCIVNSGFEKKLLIDSDLALLGQSQCLKIHLSALLNLGWLLSYVRYNIPQQDRTRYPHFSSTKLDGKIDCGTWVRMGWKVIHGGDVDSGTHSDDPEVFLLKVAE